MMESEGDSESTVLKDSPPGKEAARLVAAPTKPKPLCVIGSSKMKYHV